MRQQFLVEIVNGAALAWALGVAHAIHDARYPPPAVPLGRRVREGLILLGVLVVMIAGTSACQAHHAVYTREAGRIQEARWEAEWIVKQRLQYERREGKRVESLEELRDKFPLAAIEAHDPWGRAWVVSATDDVWICSVGPSGAGHCPPAGARAVASAADGSIGYSAQLGGWSGEPEIWIWDVAGLLALVSMVGSPMAYIAYRVIARRRGRPAPPHRRGVGLLAALVFLQWPYAFALPLFDQVQFRARQANAQADVRAMAAAITEHRARTGSLPATLVGLNGATNGETLRRYTYKRGIGGTFTIRYRHPEAAGVVACGP